MNSVSKLIIQTALRPMTVVTLTDNTWTIAAVADFAEFFDVMGNIPIGDTTEVYVNRGPGSYSGIRTGVAYVLGLLHGGCITKKQIHAYTSFDLVHAATEKKGAVYIKSWPRMPNGKLAGSNGYFEDTNGDQQFSIYEEISGTKGLLVFTEEALDGVTHSISGEALTKETTYQNLVTFLDAEKRQFTLEPLYINPVHIGS